MKQRHRRKLIKLRTTITIDDIDGILAAMSDEQRTAYVTRILWKHLRKKK